MGMSIEDIIHQAKDLDIQWSMRPKPGLQGGDRYDEQRKICNARFSYRPAAIAYCKSPEAVAGLFKIFRHDPPKIRIRSGGHQHEGMCSADDVLLIDLSMMTKIALGKDENGDFVSIGPGVSLSTIYKELGDKNFIFPGGGCGTVRPGGLVQGGGWGPYIRKYGLSCDNLLEAEVVLASSEGTPVKASEDENPDLFWAIRGGGGGNFGVVTEYKMRVHPLPESKVSFRLNWTEEHQEAVVKAWLKAQSNPELKRELTWFCRVSVPSPAVRGDEAVFIGGVFLGSKSELVQTLDRALEGAPAPSKERFTMTYPRVLKDGLEQGMDSFLAEIMNSLQFLEPVSASATSLREPQASALSTRDSRAAGTSSTKAPQTTCGGPHPHKVSSAFLTEDGQCHQLAEEVVQYIRKSKDEDQTNRYLSLHCMGGAVSDKGSEDTAFVYRKSDVLLQFQAWWGGQGEDEDDDVYQERMERYIRWIQGFRESLSHLKGAFINFVDADVPLGEYYGENFERLKRVKAKYDSGNLFKFPMSIPLP